jgi:hypothetical protein
MNVITLAVMKQCAERGFDYDAVSPNHRISWNNSKLKADGIASFNLPPISTCPARGLCERYCYATQGNQWFKSGYLRRVAAYKATLADDFVTVMVAHLISERVRILRIHDSGDFYSPQYMLQWFKIAESLPNVTFYAYTKQVILMRKLWDKKPDNLKLIQSIGGKFDDLIDTNKPHARIFASLAELLTANYTDTSVSDKPAATIGVNNIGLIIHGVKKKQFTITRV